MCCVCVQQEIIVFHDRTHHLEKSCSNFGAICWCKTPKLMTNSSDIDIGPNQALLTATTTIFNHTIVIGIILYCVGMLMYLENKPLTIEYVYIILVL